MKTAPDQSYGGRRVLFGHFFCSTARGRSRERLPLLLAVLGFRVLFEFFFRRYESPIRYLATPHQRQKQKRKTKSPHAFFLCSRWRYIVTHASGSRPVTSGKWVYLAALVYQKKKKKLNMLQNQELHWYMYVIDDFVEL